MATNVITRIRNKINNMWRIDVYEGGKWLEVAATGGARRDAERLEREIQKERNTTED